MAKDYYKILGVDRNASQEEIKRAFRKLTRKYHPDVAGKDSEEKFKEINEAFQVLSDPQKKAQYDQSGFTDFGSEDFAGPEGFNFDDIFSDIFNIFSDRRRAERGRAGADLRYDLDISLEQAFSGLTTKIEIPVPTVCKKCKGTGAKEGKLKTCPYCNGLGQIRKTQRTPFGQSVFITICNKCGGSGNIIEEKCEDCNGTGRVKEEKKIEVKIPKGVDENSYLRIPGQGEPGYNGGSPGDLYIIIHIKPHDIFEREGNDLLCKTTVDLFKAIFGGEIEVRTIDGKTNIKLPKGTQSHTTFRLRGQGIPDLYTGERGDELIKVTVEIPKRLSRKQETLLREAFGKKEDRNNKEGKLSLNRLKDLLLL